MGDRVRREDLPEDMPTVRDPHHNGFNLWGYHDGKLYHSNEATDWWQEANSASFTPDRFRAIASILPDRPEQEDDDGR